MKLHFGFELAPEDVAKISRYWFFGVVVSVIGWTVVRFPDVTPESDRYGWSSEAAEDEETVAAVAEMPPFQIVGPNGEIIVQDNENAVAKLWDAVLEIRGSHLENTPQQVGDCVSWGVKHAIEYLIYVEMKTGPPGELEFHEVFAPYIYGISRVQIGGKKLGGRDGSCGAWAARGVMQYGLLRSDFDGVPPYSGSVARSWGSSGPPDKFVQEGKRFLVKQTSLVRTADEIRDAICNGYPCTVASNVGFNTIIKKYGRLLGVRNGTWGHQMAVIGFDGSAPEPLYYIINSWGPHAHGDPIDNSPPGGFWITKKDMDAMARQGDSFAFSNFEGFKSRDEFRINIFGKAPKKEGKSLAQAL